MVDAGERLQVLLRQEASIYRTTDYLTRMSLGGINVGSSFSSGHNHPAVSPEQPPKSLPSSPNKRKSSQDLISVEEEEESTSAASATATAHHRHCRNRKWNPATTTPSQTASTTTTGSSSSGALTATTAAAAGTTTGGCGPATANTNGCASRSVGSSSSSTASASTSTSSSINKHWREKICEWAYQVVDHFDLNREVVSTAMSHLDRYLGTYEGIVDKNLFQLLAMTCLYLSIKLNEYKHLLIPGSKSSMDTILQLSRGFFTLEEMEKMEYEVLQRLQWFVHPPTSQIFMKHFLFFLSVEENELHDLAQFMIELSVMDYFFVSYRPSEIALAALLNSMDKLEIHTNTRQFPFNYLDLQSPAVLACRERLSLIYAQANEQGGAGGSEDEATATPNVAAKSSTDPPVPEPARLQRTISPVSVMSTGEEQQQQKKQYASSPYASSKHHHQQEMIDVMETDEGYFYGESVGEDDGEEYYM